MRSQIRKCWKLKIWHFVYVFVCCSLSSQDFDWNPSYRLCLCSLWVNHANSGIHFLVLLNSTFIWWNPNIQVSNVIKSWPNSQHVEVPLKIRFLVMCLCIAFLSSKNYFRTLLGNLCIEGGRRLKQIQNHPMYYMTNWCIFKRVSGT